MRSSAQNGCISSCGYRHLLLLVLTALFSAGFVAARPKGADRGLPEPRFWAAKLAHRGDCGVVLAGCSRVYCGLAPAAMAPILGTGRILNYGFSNQAYSDAYLQAVPRALDPASRRRTIVLGIAPHNFLAARAATNQFNGLAARNGLAHLWDRGFGGLLDPYDMGANRPGAGKWRFSVEYHADGWGALTREPADPLAAIPAIEDLHADELPSYRLIDGLVAACRDWTRRGIRVYATRLPLPPRVAAAEEAASGFAFESVRLRLAEAGCTWLEVKTSDLASADGSHLPAPSAWEYSQRLAAAMAEHELRRSRPAGRRT
jgi:hypothetical protein